MINIKLIFFITLLFLLRFTSYSQSCSCVQKEISKLYALNDSLLSIWRGDQHGCLQKRINIIDSIFIKDILVGMPKSVFLLLYGEPDRVTQEGVLVYENVNECINNKQPTKETYGIEMTIIFIDNKLSVFEKVYVN